MKTYTVTVKYIAENTYIIDAEDEDSAESIAWDKVHAEDHKDWYGQWETVSIEQMETSQ